MSDQSRPPRIHDVAKLAGVSVATVSRAISNPSIVSETTRKAVEAAIAQTGYTLNFTARNLRQQQVGGVLALVPKLSNPFFSQILSGISEVLRDHHLSLLVLDTTAVPDQPAMTVLGPYLNRSRSDGVIVLDGRLDAGLFDRPGCPPLVQACEWIEGLDAPRVLADNATGGRLAAQHLADLGHRRILHLTGPQDSSLTRSRRQGFLQGLADAGLPAPGPQDSITGDFTAGFGRDAAQQLLTLPDRPTAVFCDNDEMAIGLMNGLIGAGLRVPQDISVMGFDNIEMAAFCIPGLTTIRQYRARLGRRAAELLLARMAGRGSTDSITLGVDLLVRGSTGPAPAR
ncbi:LacI family DNA-binding transcriptional regulator [Paracoccus nototheniae]|uniref:LacI family DNA-binding transcriptional regulator n=1 Tax=Paracoccus nototheniae TaxID=2489002 RepID=A0ABW4DZB4_9RHOB|nr:LacI family DNA-binding transcriptional regulator [Paracoccus nototheniae]